MALTKSKSVKVAKRMPSSAYNNFMARFIKSCYVASYDHIFVIL